MLYKFTCTLNMETEGTLSRRWRVFRYVRKIAKSGCLRRVSVCVCVCLSLSNQSPAWENSAPHQTDFHDVWYLRFFFRKSVQKILVCLKSGKNDGYFTRRRTYIVLCFSSFFLECETFKTEVVEKIITLILWTITFFFKSYRWWDMWENIVELDRPQMTM
jgi:hypothetical protein